MKLVLLGPPGAGKGTQAEILAKKLSVPRISTGDILRDAVKRNTAIGIKARPYMGAGSLVPDEVVVGIVIDRISKADCKNGFVLDGMPRTIAQAEALDEQGVELDVVLSIQISDEEIQARLGGRRACLSCGASYHLISNPPKTEAICDMCGKTLIIRDDDEPEKIKKRLNTFHKETEPLKAYYKMRNKLKTVDNIPGVEAVTAVIFKTLGIEQ